MFQKNKKSQKAFTLIELLVVVAIISLLSSVVMASLNTARAKSRDAKRLSDMKQIQIALELYRSENNAYPTAGSGFRSGSSTCYGSTSYGYDATGYIPGIVPTYISVLPEDPKGLTVSRCYLYWSNGTDYKFLIWNTIENYNASSSLIDPGYGGVSGSTCVSAPRPNSYSVYTPGGKCI
jgi:general secretion pathway protein G